MIKIRVFTFNEFFENTLIVWDEVKKDAAVIDPGNSNDNENKILSNFVFQERLSLKYLINTHCHIDHILGINFIKENFNPVYYAPENDLPLLQNATVQAEMFGLKILSVIQPDFFITEEINISIGNSAVKFLFTPGHSPGEYCLYFEKEKICITGDVLFKESIGRTDLWGGNFNTILNSINKKLMTLPDDVIIYPGHGEISSIGHERINNPFLNS